MNVIAFSRRVGLSAHTLRYYEKIGLLRDVRRRPNGHREFSERDAEAVAFILRLKETGMPLEQMIRYAELRSAGNATLRERQNLLHEHAQRVVTNIEAQQQHLAKLREKVATYDDLIEAAERGRFQERLDLE